ncbi:ABC transporter permease [Terriglobus aquaticus]|uniref:ABC transporter permease n=1 Tax=Terriglobus aquaticus TaxID=940139 RepID=A0ABW9KIF9_9BACT|nr:FtsX-like permease family protein [Terriglobus aquaticus]
MAALPWSTAARVAWRELRASRTKFLFVVLSVAVGVAALTGVRGFSASFRHTLLIRARSILAGDLGARMFQQPTPKQLALLDHAAAGLRRTTVTEMASMATAANSMDPLLVALKAIDPREYPYYGRVDLQPSMPLEQAVGNDSVAVGEDLLIRLRLHVGDSITLGDRTFRIAAVVESEPDRLSGAFAAGPRVLSSQQQLAETHLLATGSRASERFLFKLPSPDDRVVAKLKAAVEEALPEANVSDYRETNPAITVALDRATDILSLVSLVALVLGALGVAMAMRTHLLERLDSIAIMKSLGAQSSSVVRIYLLQTIFLGLLGGVVGVLLGVAVQVALPLLLGRMLGLSPELHIAGSAVLTGILTGLIITVLFTLPPLLDIRNVRPISILRRAVDAEPAPALQQLRQRLRANLVQVGAMVLILAGLATIAGVLSESRKAGLIFVVALVAVLLALIAAAALLLWILRRTLQRTRFSLPPAVRHGLANLYRPGNPSAALLAALGLGVMQVAIVFFLGQAFTHELKLSTRTDLPNVFLVDIADNELLGLQSLLKQQPEVRGTPEFVPVLSSRILSVDGVPAAQLKLKNFPQRMLQSITLTWSETLPEGTTVLQGKFWQPGETRAQLAIGERHAERLGVKLHSHIVFAAGSDADRPIDAEVSAIVRSDGQHAYSRAEFILPRAPLDGISEVWYGAVHSDPNQVGELQRALYAKYPTVTVINVAQAFEQLRKILVQVQLVVQFLAGFSIFAGLVILASAVAGTRYRRVREVVVLKTLGATRLRIGSIFTIEFAVLGLVAGLVGLLFANLSTRALLRQMDLGYHLNAAENLGMWILVALLTVATGWLASYRILGQKPLEVLREE